jgi:hypothetical protein
MNRAVDSHITRYVRDADRPKSSTGSLNRISPAATARLVRRPRLADIQIGGKRLSKQNAVVKQWKPSELVWHMLLFFSRFFVGQHIARLDRKFQIVRRAAIETDSDPGG